MTATFLVLLGLTTAVSALEMNVQRGTQQCVRERVDARDKLSGAFQVISPDSAAGEVQLVVRDQDRNVFLSSVLGAEGDGRFDALAKASGFFECCVKLTGQSEEAVVGFQIRRGDALYQQVAQAEHVKPLETDIAALKELIDQVEDQQQFMWARSLSRKHTVASTQTRVLVLSVLEMVVLVGMAAFQFSSLRRFFGRAVSA